MVLRLQGKVFRLPFASCESRAVHEHGFFFGGNCDLSYLNCVQVAHKTSKLGDGQ